MPRGADSGFAAFISSTHITVSTRGPIAEPCRRAEVPPLALQTKINNPRTSRKAHSFPQEWPEVSVGCRAPAEPPGAVECCCDCVLDGLIVITGGLRLPLGSGRQSLAIVAWPPPLPDFFLLVVERKSNKSFVTSGGRERERDF